MSEDTTRDVYNPTSKENSIRIYKYIVFLAIRLLFSFSIATLFGIFFLT